MSEKQPHLKAGSGRSRTSFTKRDLDHAQKVGFEDGLQKGRQEILDWLQAAYIDDPGRPDRGTPKAEAILELATAAGNHFRNLTTKKGRRK